MKNDETFALNQLQKYGKEIDPEFAPNNINCKLSMLLEIAVEFGKSPEKASNLRDKLSIILHKDTNQEKLDTLINVMNKLLMQNIIDVKNYYENIVETKVTALGNNNAESLPEENQTAFTSSGLS